MVSSLTFFPFKKVTYIPSLGFPTYTNQITFHPISCDSEPLSNISALILASQMEKIWKINLFYDEEVYAQEVYQQLSKVPIFHFLKSIGFLWL